jgi:hypothetical protein
MLHWSILSIYVYRTDMQLEFIEIVLSYQCIRRSIEFRGKSIMNYKRGGYLRVKFLLCKLYTSILLLSLEPPGLGLGSGLSRGFWVQKELQNGPRNLAMAVRMSIDIAMRHCEDTCSDLKTAGGQSCPRLALIYIMVFSITCCIREKVSGINAP